MKKFYLFLCSVSMLFLNACGQNKDFIDIKEVKTDFGVTAWLVEDHTLPIISMRFAFNQGSVMDTVETQGAHNLMARMLTHGAGPHDNKTFKALLDNQNITLEFGATRDALYGSLKTLTKNKENAAEYLRLALTEPHFDEGEFETLKSQSIARIKSNLSRPDWVAARLNNDIVYQDHPYALNSGGTLSSLKNISTETLRERHTKALSTKDLNIVVVGDITSIELKEYLVSIFGNIPKTKDGVAVPTIPVQNLGQKYLYEMDIPQTFLKVIWPGVTRKDDDYYKVEVMNHIFGGGGFGSRLMEEIREKRGLTYGVYSRLNLKKHANYLSSELSTQNATAKEALDLIMLEAKNLTQASVSEDELQAAKDYLIGSLPLKFTSSDQITSVLLDMRLKDLPRDAFDKRTKIIRDMTLDDIQDVAKKLLSSEPLIVAVGKPDGFDLDSWSIIEDIPNAE